MPSVFSVVDLARLLPAFALNRGSEAELAMNLENGFFPTICKDCGTRFRVELASDGMDILFNYEDLLCPKGCNQASVASADFNEQARYDELERFFELEPDPAMLPPGVLYLRMLLPSRDN